MKNDEFEFADNQRRYFDYEISKLYDRHPIFGISYFKEELTESVLIEELNNMEKNIDNDFEYYCSFEYLTK